MPNDTPHPSIRAECMANAVNQLSAGKSENQPLLSSGCYHNTNNPVARWSTYDGYHVSVNFHCKVRRTQYLYRT